MSRRMRQACSWLSAVERKGAAVNYCEVFAGRLYACKHLYSECLLFGTQWPCLDAFLLKVSVLLQEHNGPESRVQVADTCARAVGVKASMAQNEISFRAAQSYIETYYLQLNAAQVSFIHSPTKLQTTQHLTGPFSPSCLTASYIWTVNRTNKSGAGKVEGKR